MKKINLLFSLMFAAVVLQAQTVNVTLKVDMTGLTVSTDSVHVVGSFNGWNPTANVLTQEGTTNIYFCVLAVKPGGDVEYKFMNGNAWGKEESAPMSCTTGNSHNRIVTSGLTDLVVPAVLFNQCPTSVPVKNISFFVDMEGLTVDTSSVHVAGNFNGWNPSFTKLTLYSGTVYKATYPVLASITKLEYKYVNGSSWGKDETAVGAPCADATSHNRLYTMPAGDGSVKNYKFNTCTETQINVGVKNAESAFNFEVFPTISSDYINVKFESANKNEIQFNVYSISGVLVSAETMNRTEANFVKRVSVAEFSKGVYILEVANNGSKSVKRFIVN
jgi:hypothetical protein